jgi:hypothetical protein
MRYGCGDTSPAETGGDAIGTDTSDAGDGAASDTNVATDVGETGDTAKPTSLTLGCLSTSRGRGLASASATQAQNQAEAHTGKR